MSIVQYFDNSEVRFIDELAYSTADIGNGSALGKFVAKAIAPAFIERVGKYEVKHYQVNDALDTAIKTYFGMKHSLAS